TSTSTSRPDVPPLADNTTPSASNDTGPAPVSIDTDAGDCGTGGHTEPGSQGVETISVTLGPSTAVNAADADVSDPLDNGSGRERSTFTDETSTCLPFTTADIDGE